MWSSYCVLYGRRRWQNGWEDCDQTFTLWDSSRRSIMIFGPGFAQVDRNLRHIPVEKPSDCQYLFRNEPEVSAKYEILLAQPSRRMWAKGTALVTDINFAVHHHPSWIQAYPCEPTSLCFASSRTPLPRVTWHTNMLVVPRE